MANFVAVLDRDVARRAAYCATLRSLIAPVPGLIVGECAGPDIQIVWACSPSAPLSQQSDQHGAAVVWGVAMDESGRRTDAAGLRAQWSDLARHTPVPFDGYHAAISYSKQTGLTAGADVLGMFPVYWTTVNDAILIGSSPELFRHYPGFTVKLDPLGLAGILLTMHLLHGRTLLEGVHRLSPGHLLAANGAGQVKEVQQYRIPATDRYFDYTYTAQLNILDEAVSAAVRRHAPAENDYGLLLSGGLDSRMLGGYLSRHNVSPVALTLGVPGDIEVKCARQVARTLQLEQRIVNIEANNYQDYMQLQARWEHGANGFNTITSWGIYPHLRSLAPNIITGYSMDCVLGGPLFQHELSSPGSFDAVFPYYCRYGFQPTMLAGLLRQESHKEALRDSLDRMRHAYQGYSVRESQREWCFELFHRQRFHVGAIAWRLSFGAWPVLPAVDSNVLAIAGGMPPASMAERRAQKDMLCKYFPALAELPLDRNSHVTTPLQPRLRWLITQNAQARVKSWTRRFAPGFHFGARERRIYFREYNINGPGWRAVRRCAEPHRKKLYDLLDRDTLDKILPAPEENIQVQDGIVEVSGLKSILGLMLWAKEYL